MSARRSDVLELLLPDAPPAVATRARTLTTFLRLLTNDARPAAAASVRVSLESARGELERDVRARLQAALVELLRHHLYACLGPESFAWLGECQAEPQAAWSVLEESREELPRLPSVTAPNESAISVVERLLEAAAWLELAPATFSLWSAWKERAARGASAGEGAFRHLLASAAGARDSVLTCASLAGLAECLLDKGAVRAARVVLEEHASTTSIDPRARRLLAWTRLLQGDEAAARAALVGMPPWRNRLPLALLELRQRRPEWIAFLSGRAAGGVVGSRAEEHARASRRDFGASLLGVFVLRAGGAATALHLDVAPGLRASVDEWMLERDDACAQSGEPEHRLIVAAAPVVLHRAPGGRLRGALAPESTGALALVPIRDDEGEVAGWLRIECEHHLVPAEAHLAREAERWRVEVLGARGAVSHEHESARIPRAVDPRMLFSSAGSATSTGVAQLPDADGTPHATSRAPDHLIRHAPNGPCARAFRALIEELGMKTAQRHWWGFEVQDGVAHLAADGGAALLDRRRWTGGRKALGRALLSGGVVDFEDPDPRLSLHSEAASGAVLPLHARGKLCGLLAIESVRRGDFQGALMPRLVERVQRHALSLRVAQFRTWHEQRFGFDVQIGASASGMASHVGDLVAAGRARSPVVLTGPPGCGKQVIARWLHFESAREGPLLVLACGASTDTLSPRVASGALQRARGGSLVLDDVERLHAEQQVQLLELLGELEAEGASEAPLDVRLVATTQDALADSAREGRLRGDLCQRLERLQLFVPALADRREEIGALVLGIVQRFAARERVAPPRIGDETMALLWRQPWEGNVRQLENLLYKLVLLHAGRDVTISDVEELARRFRLELVRRVPSRHPGAQWITAALQSTCNQRGSINKTRAALYLGWDPDTLVSRMKDAGMSESGVVTVPRAVAPQESEAPDEPATPSTIGAEPQLSARKNKEGAGSVPSGHPSSRSPSQGDPT